MQQGWMVWGEWVGECRVDGWVGGMGWWCVCGGGRASEQEAAAMSKYSTVRRAGGEAREYGGHSAPRLGWASLRRGRPHASLPPGPQSPTHHGQDVVGHHRRQLAAQVAQLAKQEACRRARQERGREGRMAGRRLEEGAAASGSRTCRVDLLRQRSLQHRRHVLAAGRPCCYWACPPPAQTSSELGAPAPHTALDDPVVPLHHYFQTLRSSILTHRS